MSLYILALFSLILVIPIMYLLPLGLSNRGKFIIIGIGFLISVIGIMSRSLFPIWQSALIMLLFLIIATYVIMKKWTSILFISAEESSDEIYEYVDEPKNNERKSKQPEEAAFLIQPEEEDLIVETPDLKVEEELPKQDEMNIPEQTMARNDLDSIDIDLDLLEKVDSLEEIDEIEVVSVDERNEGNVEPSQIKEPAVTEISYLAEIEKLLEEEDSSVMAEAKDSKMEDVIEEITFPIVEDVEVAASQEKDSQVNLPMDELELLDDIEELVDLDFMDQADDKEVLSAEESSAVRPSTTDIEMLEDLALFAIEEEVENPIESVEENNLPEQEVSLLAHKIINNTLSQLNVMKGSVDREHFESILLQCMNEKMPLNEYFAFATLLVDLYIQNKDNDKLLHLLMSLKDKFYDQPIVLEQIEFMEEQYLN